MPALLCSRMGKAVITIPLTVFINGVTYLLIQAALDSHVKFITNLFLKFPLYCNNTSGQRTNMNILNWSPNLSVSTTPTNYDWQFQGKKAWNIITSFYTCLWQLKFQSNVWHPSGIILWTPTLNAPLYFLSPVAFLSIIILTYFDFLYIRTHYATKLSGIKYNLNNYKIIPAANSIQWHLFYVTSLQNSFHICCEHKECDL